MAVLVAMLGGFGVLLGLGWYARARVAARDARPATVLTVVSGLMLLLPDVPQPSTSVVADLYRMVVIGWLGIVAAGMALTSARSLDAIRSRLRRLFRRRPPTTWQQLIEQDQALARRLLAYQHDLELAVNAPVMCDYTDPLTAAAVEAMLLCDAVRTPTPPPGARSVDATEYGRAVRAFDAALSAAQAQAARMAASSLTEDERQALRKVADIVAFLDAHPSTPAERAAAYATVDELLAGFPHHGHDPRTAREHPFLTVAERAR